MEQSNLLGTHWVVGVPCLELSTTGSWVSVSAPPKLGPRQGLFRGAAPFFLVHTRNSILDVITENQYIFIRKI